MMDKKNYNHLWKESTARETNGIGALNTFIPHNNKEPVQKYNGFILVILYLISIVMVKEKYE